jgi:hypothetical protein
MIKLMHNLATDVLPKIPLNPALDTGLLPLAVVVVVFWLLTAGVTELLKTYFKAEDARQAVEYWEELRDHQQQR